MDELLIRRLLGGLVLIVLAWLVAALLPPPKPVTERDEDTVVIDLRPVEERAEEVATLPPAAPESPSPSPESGSEPLRPIVPTPMASPEASRTPAATPRPSAAPTPAIKPTATPGPKPTPAATAAPPAAGQFWVQVGAYGTRESAEQVRESLGVAGLSARVISADVGGKQVHRVRIGPFRNRGEAESAHARAVLLGYGNAQVVGS